MRQIATVERVVDARYAVISVPRKTACGHDCAECAGCGVTGAAVKARAENPVGARPGERVIVESSTRKTLGIAALVYLTPLLLFLAGYVLAAVLTPRTGVQYGAAAVCFALGLIPAVCCDRRIRAGGGFSFTIVRVL